jgi:DNA-binding NtrC family response regulator
MARILICEQDALLGTGMSKAFARLGYDAELVRDGEVALRSLRDDDFQVFVFDATSPGLPPLLETLGRVRQRPDPPLCFVLATRPTLRTVVDAVRRGATDVLEKPLDLSDVATRVDQALQTATMRTRLARLSAGERFTRVEEGPVAKSAAMVAAFSLAERVAASPSSSALILGESGVGKEVVAQRIHECSKRAGAPYLRVNLAAIPESMVEAELFGSVRGAFTDSRRDRMGYLASAEGGTLLLDELCEFKIELQAKLLRVLEDRSYRAVGSDRERRANVRIIAATNRDPIASIQAGRLRADLYYRLAAMTITVPPLRERREDIVPLAERFLRKLSLEFGVPKPELTLEAQAFLERYSWPGNVRELRNAIERAVMLCDGGELTPDILALPLAPSVRPPGEPADAFDPPSASSIRIPAAAVLADPVASSGVFARGHESGSFALASAASSGVLRDSREQFERARILSALEQASGSRVEAARLLGVSRTTLWAKLKRLGIR